MTPKAVCYSPSETISELLTTSLSENHIKSTTDLSETKLPYFFAIIFSISDVTKLKNILSSDTKKVISLPLSLKGSIDIAKFPSVKLIYFSELITSKVSHRYGFANWIIENLKTNSKVFLPEADTEIYPIFVDELVKLMIKEGFSYFKTSETFVYHSATVKHLAQWIKKVDSNLLVSIDKDIKLHIVSPDFSKLETKILPLTGQSLSKLYLSANVKQKVITSKRKLILPKVSFPKRLFFLSFVVTFLPFILFFASIASLYSANLNLKSGNTVMASNLFKLTEAISETNLSITSPFGENDLKKGIVASLNAVKLARLVSNTPSVDFSSLEALESASEDYQALYKDLSFYKLDQDTQSGVFSKIVSSIDLETIDTDQVLTLSRFSTIADVLLGEDSEINYLLVEIQDNYSDKAAVVTVEDSLVREASIFSDNFIDDRMLGLVEAPNDFTKYVSSNGFKFRHLSWHSDFETRATLASWFIEKSLNQKIDVVVFTNQDISLLVGDLQKGNIFENKELIGKLYNDLNSKDAYVWSNREELNSVFVAQGYSNKITNTENVLLPYIFPLERNINLKQEGEYKLTTDADSYSVDYTHKVINQSEKDISIYQRFILAKDILYHDFKVNGKEVKPELIVFEKYQELGFYLDIKKGETAEINLSWSFLKTQNVNVIKQEFSSNLELHLTLDGNSLYNTNLVP